MNIVAAITRFAAEYSAIMQHARTGHRPGRSEKAIRDLPPEIREDVGYPDSCTARMSARGHRRPCHETW